MDGGSGRGTRGGLHPLARSSVNRGSDATLNVHTKITPLRIISFKMTLGRSNELAGLILGAGWV